MRRRKQSRDERFFSFFLSFLVSTSLSTAISDPSSLARHPASARSTRGTVRTQAGANDANPSAFHFLHSRRHSWPSNGEIVKKRPLEIVCTASADGHFQRRAERSRSEEQGFRLRTPRSQRERVFVKRREKSSTAKAKSPVRPEQNTTHGRSGDCGDLAGGGGDCSHLMLFVLHMILMGIWQRRIDRNLTLVGGHKNQTAS